MLASSASAATLPLAYHVVALTPATKIAVLFSKNTSFAQLAAIRQDLQKDGIELEYQALEFNEKGDLLKISFRVDCRDSFVGSATSNDLTTENSFGFCRDYTKNAAKPFQIGQL
ncbi:MAG: hypothetical protein EOO63_12560 [Hymenobacter sp.]|nr:MAG: hypothetical protein EOO63_12560 [Hymenobacter sp.]